MDAKKKAQEIILAGEIAIDELIKVAKEPILNEDPMVIDPDLTADKLKNAAATKKLAIFDAFSILERIEDERKLLIEKSTVKSKEEKFDGFSENRAKK